MFLVALLGTASALAYYLVQLRDANAIIEKQQRELDEQRDLIDKKETFGAAMNELLATASAFDGVLMDSIVPFDSYQAMAARGWTHRWSSTTMDRDIAGVQSATQQLTDILDAAQIEATTNGTGTTYEAVIDQLGGGFVTSVIDNADGLCEADVLACVISDDPLLVHFDAADTSLPYMTDWLRTGLAYHEFAHVLQMTNPDPTTAALTSFGDDPETMADCFALTYLEGWTLDHRVWVSSYEYWDVSIGYGYTCNAEQAQVIRDWYAQLGFQLRPIS